jgi:UDP-glucose 4-epimerase
MKILVTGAAGFLGGHVARHLAATGHNVRGFDQEANPDTAYESVIGDLLDTESVTSAAEGVDAICHLGAIGDVYLAAEQPQLAAAVNVTGSANVAIAAAESGAKVVYASTWEVYGEPQYQPIDEDHPVNPDHPYNITKLAGEQLLLAADRLHGVPVTALRLGTAYGLGLRPNSVFRIFIDRARAGDPITIQGDGSQGRQFTYATDIASAFDAACRSEAHGIALNVVASETTSIKELAELVVDRYPTDLTFGEARPGDVPSALVSASLAEEILGWRATTPFEAGLRPLLEDEVDAN